MIGIDTNVLVRFIVRDDEKQFLMAKEIFENNLTKENPGYVNLVVSCELSWLLLRTYKIPKDIFIQITNSLICKSQLVFQYEEALLKAVETFKEINADFHDILIHHANAENDTNITLTFDKNAAKRINGFQLVEKSEKT